MRRRRKLPESPVELHIDSLSHEGRGIARYEGKVSFVDTALPDEQVVARYVRSHSQFDELTLERVLTPSPERVEPQCEYFGNCGGCSLQHLRSDSQILFKQQILVDLLNHHLNLDCDGIELIPPLQAEDYFYRRKARLAVRYVSKKGGALVGFREKYSTFVTVMNHCDVLEKQLSALIEPLSGLVNQLNNKQSVPQFEVAAGDQNSAGNTSAIVMRHLEELADNDIKLLKAFAIDHDVDFYLQPGGEESIHKVWPECGPDRLSYSLPDFDVSLNFHPVDFIQINAAINREMVKLACSLLDLAESDRVLDLFCGLGNFSLPMAKLSKHVTAIEGSEKLVNRGRENALMNKVRNIDFHVADLYAPNDHIPWLSEKYQKALIDPPRSGALEFLPYLKRLEIKRIVYISCNPVTLARDAAKLKELGYRLEKAGVLDMFPHTAHVESVAVFCLNEGK